MKRETVLVIFFLIPVYTAVLAQPYKPVMLLRDRNTAHLSEYFTYWLQPFDQPQDVAIADSMAWAGHFVHWKWHRSISLGDIRMRLWVRVAVHNACTDNSNFVWSIHD